MVTKAELESELKQALRTRDDVRKRTLRMALTAIKLAEVEAGGELEPDQLQALLAKEAKARHESIEDAERAGREDLIASAREELSYLETLLPKPLTDEELEALSASVIEALGASSLSDMGDVMKQLMPKVQGRAQGRQVSDTVRRLLGEP